MANKVTLGLENISELEGGRVVIAFNQQLTRLVQDCLNRSSDQRPRTISLDMTMVPEVEDGVCAGIKAEFEITAKEPTRRSKTYSLEVHQSGKIIVTDRPDRAPEPTFAELNAAMDRDNGTGGAKK